jgi:predicted DNA-binding transcriptional regulator AlpA
MSVQIAAEYVDSNAAAAILGTTARALENMRHRRVGPPFVRLGRKLVRYRVAAIHEWMSARTCAPAATSKGGR